ncbi:MAG: M28 family metallopeptidase, partial [Bacteroidota bacterium]
MTARFTRRFLKKVFYNSRATVRLSSRRSLKVAFLNQFRNLKIAATVYSWVFQQPTRKALLFLFILPLSLCAQTPFSLDSTTVYLKILSVDIGPRPMGSPNERRAMEFATQKFKEFGLDEAYIMPIDRAASELSRSLVNTRTGIAVGVLRGSTDRAIVVGGHIDSAGPDIPGANDDGSGSAVVIELARVLSQRQHESTLVFALFGGEEQGLVGSRYFVDHYTDIDKVALMLQVDMANGSEWLIPFVDAGDRSSPAWLVKAAYEEFAALGYSGLSYPTHFFTLNSALAGGGIGSDHMPFLNRGIPAIDFTSDVNDPIHTPQDSFENVKPEGLKRSGDLVYRLVERFDGGVPEEKTSRYYLYQIGSAPLFIPLWIIGMLITVSLLLAILAALLLQRRGKAAPPSPSTVIPSPAAFRRGEESQHNRESPRRGKTLLGMTELFFDSLGRSQTSNQVLASSLPVTEVVQKDSTIPGLKLFLLMLIIQSCVWLSENLVGLIKGVRYPWWSDPGGYLVLGFLSGLFGIWVALHLASK